MRLYGIEPDAPCAFEQTFPMCARRPWPSLHRNTPVLPSPERLHACARHTPPRRVCTEIPRTPRARRPHALPTPPLTYPSLPTPGRCPWAHRPQGPDSSPCPRPELPAMPRPRRMRPQRHGLLWVVYAPSHGAVARTAPTTAQSRAGERRCGVVCVNGGRVRKQTETRMFGGQEPLHRLGEAAIAALCKPAACASTPTHTHPSSEHTTHTRTHATTALPWPVACGAAPADSADAVSTTQHDHDHDRDHDTRASQLGPQQHDDGVCTPRLTTTQATSKPDTVIRSNTLSPPQAITGRADV